MFLRRLASLCVLLLCIGTSTTARSNGRLPNSTFFHINPYDPNEWLLGATFGLLLSHDTGASYQWLCEQAANGVGGFAGADPVALWFGPGRLALAAFDNVTITQDGGCTWTSAPAPIDGLIITDMVGHPTNPNIWFVSGIDPNVTMGQIHKTEDAGRTYTTLPLSVPNVGWQAVRVATADGQRLVAVGWGISDFTGPYLAMSTDGGATWSHALVTGGPDGISGPQVVVNPADPNALLITAIRLNSNASVLMRVAAETAAGTVSITLNDGFRGAVFSADGKTVWLATLSRVLKSTDSGATFTPLAAPQNNACIDLTGDNLYACGNDARDSFALASSTDGGTTWAKRFALADIQGPLTCPAGTAAETICPALWPNTASAIGAKVSAGGPAGNGNTRFSGNGNPAKKQGCRCDGTGAGPGWAAAALAACYRLRQRSRGALSGRS